MARIFKHEAVEDYFEELNYNQPGEVLGRLATELYEASRAVCLSQIKIDCDFDFLSSLHFDECSRENKKFKSLAFARKYAADPHAYSELLLQTFSGERRDLRYFADQVASVNEQVISITDALFPNYEVRKPSITWRLTDTINENLHIDVYKEDFPDHHVRLFANLDTVPRIWHTSHTLENLLDRYLHLVDRTILEQGSPGRVCHALNFAVFGGMELAGREGLEKHIAFFEPGEVWFVDSRKVSHQIFFGRKALSTEHAVANASMSDPTKHYFELVDRSRKSYLGGS